MKLTPRLASFLCHQRSGFGSKAGGGAILLFVLFSGFSHQAVLAADGVWTLNNSGNWSVTGNWSGATIAGGAGSIADFSQLNISTARTATIDGVVASRTIGTLLFGDIDSTHGYTLAASGGGTLTFDNNGTAASITQGANSGANIISAPVLLAGSLNTNNNSASLLTVSGTLSASTLGTKTITNQGSGNGGVSLSGVISNGSGSVAIVQDSTTSALTLSGTNTFTGGVTIKMGTVNLGANNAALGVGSVTIGDSAGGSNAASLIGNNTQTYAGGIVLASSTTGTLTIGSAATATVNFSGGVTGNNNLTLAAGGTSSTLTLSSAAVNNAGTITNVGTSSGTVTLSGGVGSNVTGVEQNSATSALTVSGGITVNSGGTTLANTAGTKALTVSTGAIGGTGNLILNNNSSLAAGINITSAVNHTGTITNSGSGVGTSTISGVIGSGVTGVVQDSVTSQVTLTGVNTFSGGVTIKKGTLLASNNAAALGTGTVLLGDTSGSANATLAFNTGNGSLFTNSITVQAGGTGRLTLLASGNSASARPNGNILLNNNLTIAVDGSNRGGSNAGAFFSTSGAISGVGNLSLNVSGGLYTTNNGGTPQADSLSVAGAVSTTGSINNVGTGEGRAGISGNISNASSLNQDSATSMLTLSGTNTYTGPTNVNAGILRINTTASLPATSTTTVASGATLQIAATLSASQALTISGHGTSYSSGVLESTNNAAYSSAIVLAADSTFGSTLGTTTFTFSGPITGSGKTLTTTGAGNHALSGILDTGTGGLIKEGTGTTTLSAANTYTGLTRINNGVLLLSNTNALGGGGNLTFNGGTLRLSSTNTADYASRIVNSTGPISIDTANQNVTYSSGLASSNAGGLTKLGAATLTLSGTNAYSGITAINNGGLAFSSGALSSGNIFIDAGGVLNGNGAYADAQDWLNSGKISTSSTGGLALMSSTDVNLTGYGNLMLVTSTGGNTTYTGTITPAGGLYRLGGTTSNTSLTLSNVNGLTGTNGLVVGARNGSSASGGSVILSNSNDLTGATTVDAGTLSLAAGGTIAGSAVTVNNGATLAITSATSGSPVTRASAVTLNRGTLTVAGNATANSTESITGALTVGAGGNSIITLTPNAARNTRLDAGSLVRTAGGTALIRGTSLGVNAFGTINSANVSFTTPNLVGNGGTGTDRSIFVGVVGDTSASGTGFGATGGLLTHDATNGVRRLSGGDYKTFITDGQTTLDNIQLTSTGTTNTATINLDTTINSLSLNSTTAAGANVQLGGTGKLTLNSGVIYAGSVTATTASGISNAIDFNGREGVILAGGSSTLGLSGVLSNTGGNGLTLYGNSTITLSGASANTYTGATTVNGGTLALNKTAGVNAITGNLVINSGATVSYSASNQIADSANITVNGGSLSSINDTINDLTLTSGTATAGSSLNVAGNLSLSGTSSLTGAVQGTITVTGSTNLSDGGTITLARSQNINGGYDSVTTLGALNITNRSSGAYTAITVGHGSGLGQSGSKLVLGGDVTFTGNTTNTNTVLIDAIKGSGRQGVIELTPAAGSRTFNIGNGAAATDLKITAALLDGTGASGLIKTGAGTLELNGANTYTGATNINNGILVLGASGSIAGSSVVSVASGATLDVSAASGWTVGASTAQKLTGSGTVTGATTIGASGTLAPTAQASGGKLTLGSTVGFSAGSIFEWDLNAATADPGTGASNTGDYGQVAATGAATGTSVFAISLLGGTNGFADPFWDTAKSWTNVFTASGLSDLSAIFTTFGGSGVDATGLVAGQGQFTFNGSTTLSWSAVPEPTSALAGILLTAGLLRRRRV